MPPKCASQRCAKFIPISSTSWGLPHFRKAKQALKGDALITREPGVLLAVQTADCIPILLADTKQRAVAAIHSGWRGTAQRIAEKTLGRMQMEFGTRPQDVIAALGPGIGGCCYEVGHEVVKEFTAKFPNAREWFAGPVRRARKWRQRSELAAVAHHAPAGTRAARSARASRFDRRESRDSRRRRHRVQKYPSSGFCTACRTDLFFSYRREHTTGRLMAAIGIRS